MPRVRGLKTDATTRARLGRDLLAELEANLWAIDCQTCDRPLGSRKPSLTVVDSGEVAIAALHHARCRKPGWETVATLPGLGPHQSWRSGGFSVRGMTVVLVNPACEVATLVAAGSGWRLANLDVYLLAGLETGLPAEDKTHPGLTGVLADGTLTVHFALGGKLLGSWTCGMPHDGAVAIHRRGAVLVGVTTAVDVTTGTTPELLESLIARGQVALGWASVEAKSDVLSATVAATRGDGSVLAALADPERLVGVLQVAGVRAALPRGDGDAAHIVVTDEEAAARLVELGQPLMDRYDLTLVRLPAQETADGAAVVIGTVGQFASRPPSPAALAIVVDVEPDALPADFADRYEQVLSV
jgi:hypothetical protein